MHDPSSRPVRIAGSRSLWAIAAWAVLLFYCTFTHQPPYQSDFAAWSRYVTSAEFLAEHLVGSIGGAAIGMLGFVALAAVLRARGAPRLAGCAMAASVIGNTLVTSVFGIAAFAQPAIGRAFLAGHTDVVALYDDVNGGPLLAVALAGMLLLSTGLVLFGLGVNRSRAAPRVAGLAIAIGGPLFAIVGVILADFVQSLGAGLLVLGTVIVAVCNWNPPAPAARATT